MSQLTLISSYKYSRKTLVESVLGQMGLVKNKDYFYDFEAVCPQGFNLCVKSEFAKQASSQLYNQEIA